MKGVWGGDKNVATGYKPSIDSLNAVDPELLRRFIVAVVSSGAALSFSLTRDFGAVILTVLDGNEKHKLYPTDLQELTQALTDGLESFSTSQPPPQAKKQAR